MKRHLWLLPLAAIVGAFIALESPAGAQSLLAQASPAPASPSPAPSPSPAASPAPKPFQLNGYQDVGYTSGSVASGRHVITGRVFDTMNRAAQLHNVDLQASYTGTVGGLVELIYGDDAEYIHSYPQLQGAFSSPPFPPGYSLYTDGPGSTSKFDLNQAFASYTVGKATLIAGKYVTLAGAEVIRTPNDFTYSHSILFGYAIPFTHTGVRLTYALSPQLSLIGGVNRGWDTTRSIGANGDTSSLTAEYGATWTPSSVFSLGAQGYSGKVEAWGFNGCANSDCRRQLVDVVATYHLNRAITAIVNYDIASQTNTPLGAWNGVAEVPISPSSTARWNGIAGYISDALSPKFTATIRGEIFNDPQGYRTGFAQRWKEATLSLAYVATPRLTIRLDGRGDRSNVPFFLRSNGAGQGTLTSVGVQAIVHAGP